MLGLILLVQTAMLLVFAVEPKLILAMLGAFIAAVAVMEAPMVGVVGLIVARLFSTGAIVFFRIGKMGIGPFEPALLLCLGALVVRAMLYKVELWRPWSWRAPFLGLIGWAALSLGWSVDRTDGIGEIIPLLIALANVLVFLAFIRTWKDFQWAMVAWLGGSVLIGVATIIVDTFGIQVTTVTFQVASGGGRETGLGQQPNWYAMNLMFGVLPGMGLAILAQRRWLRWLTAGLTVFVLFMMLKAGSRGSVGAVLIGGVAMALFQPVFRRWFLRLTLAGGLIFAIGLTSDIGNSAAALLRIGGSTLYLQQNYRPMNWEVCVQMFLDTFGVGIGAGGYEDLLPSYNNYLASSIYTYPHGIFWDVMAHYGAVGLFCLFWLMWRGLRMILDLVKWTKGTVAEIFAWTMPASMLGYAAWSWVEFDLVEKPFWEFLGLYTALYLIVARARAAGETLPAWGAGSGAA